MSHVYTDDDVVNLRIPRIEDFTVVLESFCDAFEELGVSFRRVFPGATIFGGCANGRFNVCSDIDILVLVDDTETTRREIFEIVNKNQALWVALRMAQHRFIQVSVYPVFLTQLRSGETRNDKQFLRHVVSSAKTSGLLCGSYLAFEDFRVEAPNNTLLRTQNYIERKMSNLDKRLFSYPGASQEDIARMYLDTYQAPFHALRRVFDLRGLSYEDSKHGLILALRNVAEEELWVPLEELHNRWKKYVSFIESAHFHKGMEKSPFLVEDVHKSLRVLEQLHELAKNVDLASRR